MNDREIEDDVERLQLHNAAHGTAAMLLTTHMLIVLIARGVLQPGDAAVVVDEAMAYARGPGEQPSEYADLVVQALGRLRGLFSPPSAASH